MSELVYTLPPEAEPEITAEDGVGTRIDNHSDQAVARLAVQYQKANFDKFVRAFVDPVQAVENVAWQMLVERTVDAAVGAQLDMIGRIVVLPRDGATDDDYRRLLRAKITVNRSDGVPEDLLQVARLIIDDVNVHVKYEPSYPGAVIIRALDGAVPADVAALVIRFLRKTVSAGVRIEFVFTTVNPALAFSFANGPGLGFGDGAFASVEE